MRTQQKQSKTENLKTSQEGPLNKFKKMEEKWKVINKSHQEKVPELKDVSILKKHLSNTQQHHTNEHRPMKDPHGKISEQKQSLKSFHKFVK